MTWELKDRREGQVFTALIFLAIGSLLLLNNLDFLEMRPLITHWWPVILMVLGVKHFFLWRGSAAWIGGLFWFASGALFLASTLDYIQIGVTRLIWPLVLIWVGVLIALGPNGHCGGRSIDEGSKL